MPSSATWMDLDISILSEGSQKDKQHIAYTWNIDNDTHDIHVYKTEIYSHRKQIIG